MNYDYYVHSQLAKEKVKKFQEQANCSYYRKRKKAKDSKFLTTTNIFKWITN